MNPRGLNTRKSTTTQSGEELRVAVRKTLYNIDAQSQRSTQQQGITNQRPTGTKDGDTTTRLTPRGAVALAVYDSKSNYVEATIPPGLADDLAHLLKFQTGTTDPGIPNFPLDGDWGWYLNTSTNKLWVPRNYNGVLIYPDFVSISGTISDIQHGSRSGGTLHANATTSTAGFESAADKTNLDANTADLAAATSAATANELVRRNASAGASFGGTLAAAAATVTSIKIGANGTVATHVEFGTAQLVSGDVTVTNSNVTANSQFWVGVANRGFPSTIGAMYYVTKAAGASFRIRAMDLSPGNVVTTDGSLLWWLMINP